ncbi:hypothetical protein [Streptomyces sp. bgisy153]|uniref:hypothetical protein n=1 Tax=Streptomyces sp. bgisy153 TaxID=3413793 RepID=UPI003D724F18
MGKPMENRSKAATLASARGFLFSLTILCLVGAGAWFGYVQFFTKGLQHLPAKVCEDTVDRKLVTQVLPSARSAEESSRRRHSGEDLEFYCHVDTSGDSSLLGETRVRAVSKGDWLKSYQEGKDIDHYVRASFGDIEALASRDSEYAAIYVPCTPQPTNNAASDRAVITRVFVSGASKEAGVALRQTLTDIAYQLTEHVYKIAECQEIRNFPSQLPRYQGQ